MKRLLIVAVLFAAISSPANAMLGPGGTQRLPGSNGGGIQSLASKQAACKRQGKVYYQAPGQIGRCVKGLGASAPVANQARLAPMNTSGGIQRMPGSNGGGVQNLASRQAMQRRSCKRQGFKYQPIRGQVGYCVKPGLMGASAPVANQARLSGVSTPAKLAPAYGRNGGGQRQLVGQGGGSF